MFLSTLLGHQARLSLELILRLGLIQQLLLVLEPTHIRHFEKVKTIEGLIHELAPVCFVRAILLLLARVVLISVFYDFLDAGHGA